MDGEQNLQVRIAQVVGLEEPSADNSGEVNKIQLPEVNSFEPLQKYFGIEEADARQTDQLKTIWNHYSKDKENDGEVLKAIRDIQSFLVTPDINQSRLSQIADYVKVVKDVETARAKKEAYQKELK
jgi:hypothetical protein